MGNSICSNRFINSSNLIISFSILIYILLPGCATHEEYQEDSEKPNRFLDINITKEITCEVYSDTSERPKMARTGYHGACFLRAKLDTINQPVKKALLCLRRHDIFDSEKFPSMKIVNINSGYQATKGEMDIHPSLGMSIDIDEIIKTDNPDTIFDSIIFWGKQRGSGLQTYSQLNILYEKCNGAKIIDTLINWNKTYPLLHRFISPWDIFDITEIIQDELKGDKYLHILLMNDVYYFSVNWYGEGGVCEPGGFRSKITEPNCAPLIAIEYGEGPIKEVDSPNNSIKIKCPKCNKELHADAKYCPECGQRIGNIKCPKCGRENNINSKYCVNCGEKLDN